MHCMRTFTVQVILVCIFSTQIAISTVVKGSLPDPQTISKIFNVIKPILRYLPINSPMYRRFKQTTVNKAIRDKIEELKTILQDNDIKDSDDNLMLEDGDDTTIIEFLPKTNPVNKSKTNQDDILKDNLNKYKKLRDKINKALIKEEVSDKTKQLVKKTLDDLIKTLIGSQCRWKRNVRAKKFEETTSLANRWNKGIRRIRALLYNLFSGQNARRNEIPKFLENIQLLFDSVTNDIDTISKRYKIICEFVPKHNSINALRNTWDDTDIEEDECLNLVICSTELEEFILNFYVSLNDSSVKVIKDYTEMYIRDVDANETNEKEFTIKLLTRAAKNLEGYVKEVFIKDTNNLVLDHEKKAKANIKHLSNYIKHTVKSVKKVAKKMLESELVSVRDTLLNVIMDDIKVNMEVDLGNLEREYITKICSNFQICNGKNIARRQFTDTDKNNLYVHVELTLDDDEAVNALKEITNVEKAKNFNLERNLNVNVTRTTYINNITTTQPTNKIFLE